MRVTQNMLYTTSLSGMQRTSAALVESNIQSATQLRINKPSDDPVGAGRVISYRASIERLSLYEDNISQATGWLSTADSILSNSVTTLITKFTELAEQGATGTYNADNREEMSYQLRELYNQLINIANTEYAGKHIFAGQKTDSPAYGAALGVDCHDSGNGLADVKFEAEGSASSTVMIQATSTGLSENASYRYSADGGTTWINIGPADITQDYPETGRMRITAGGASVIMDMGVQVNAVDTDSDKRGDNGTWFYIRPTAQYLGDDNDTQVVIPYGSATNTAADVSASGTFRQDVAVRIDSNDGTTVTFSYSSDDGSTWTQGKTPATSPLKLPVSGGYLNLENSPAAGEQYVIHPHRAEISLDISATDSIVVNLIGKDVFGGIYQNPATGEKEVVENGGNLFEVVGQLIAAAETNDQQGMSEALDGLKEALNVILTKASVVGGRETRLSVTAETLDQLKYDQTERMSAIEDVDILELTSRLAMQEIAYSAVLQSSSSIMQMGLLNYL